jgi:hypothetical protein
MEDYPRLEKEEVLSYQRETMIYYNDVRLVNEYSTHERDHVLSYRKNLFKHTCTEQSSGTSLFRMVLSKDDLFGESKG